MLIKLGPPASAPDVQARTLVGCGPIIDGSVEIVEPESRRPCTSNAVGEIWISGTSVAHGYWNRPEDSATTFEAFTSTGRGPYLRSGDLGFIRGGELFVTGRIKELIMKAEQEKVARDFWEEIEREAEKFEVTVDYYLAEFY